LWENYLNPKKARSQTREVQQWGPHIETHWNQRDPYNKHCPIDPETGRRSLTGCGPTAKAQIMNYWKYPLSAIFDEKDGYQTDRRGIKIDADHEKYDFPSFNELNQMLADIDYEDEDDIGVLHFACGIASIADYASNTTLSTNISSEVSPFIKKFGYATAEKVYAYQSQENFFGILKMDMKYGRPAGLTITETDQSGVQAVHAIVADGFKTTGEYHLNFGWGDDTNAWYFLPEDLPEPFHFVSSGTLKIYPHAEQELYYVDADIPESGDGMSWATAFKTIQEAAVFAACNDAEIWVKQGTYRLESTIEPYARKVALYGGFNGTETKREERDWQNNLTVIDGQNQVRCFYNENEMIIDGFTISNGNSKDDETGFGGGAIRNHYSESLNINAVTATIANCTFSNNTADRGGAIYNYSSSEAENGDIMTVTVNNCTFSENSASSKGGSGLQLSLF